MAVGSSCTVSVTFTPGALGLTAGSLTFVDNASDSPQTVTLSGTGTASAVSFSTPALLFSYQIINTTSAAMAETVTNTGTAALIMSSVTMSGANASDFAMSADTCTGATIPPNANCTVSVTFTPSATGSRGASLVFTDNASGSPQTISLTGTGALAPPLASLSSASMTFGVQGVGTTSAAQPLTLTNTGGTALSISNVGISSGFNLTSGFPSSLGPGASFILYVTFAPTAAGNYSGSMTITDNSNGVTGSIQTVSLAGTAIVLPPVAAPVTLKTVSSSPASITLSATDAYGYALTFSIVTGPANGTLSAVTPLNSTSAAVTYTPNAGFAGTDSFVYAATDTLVNSGSATVNITVTGNPVPEISQPVAPDAVAPGAADFSLSINGAGFEPGAVVNWQQGSVTTPLATTLVSPTQVTATVPASLVATAGTAWATVKNPSPGGGASNTVFFSITNATSSVSLALAAQVATGSYPDFVVVGDFNGDGKLDLAVANASSNTVSILLGDGSGNFTLKATLPTGETPSGLAVADFNGDGKLDLAVINGSGSTLTVLLGNGDGTFSSPSFSMPFASPLFVVAGDFNGDGKMDLAVSTYPQTVVILLGNGDGTFTVSSSTTVGDDPSSLAVGDFNGDGKLDLAVVNSLSNIVMVLLGNGDGTLTLSRPFPATAGDPTSVAVADFNGDGKLDLAVANGESPGMVSIFLGNGDGTFQPANSFAAGVSRNQWRWLTSTVMANPTWRSSTVRAPWESRSSWETETERSRRRSTIRQDQFPYTLRSVTSTGMEGWIWR